MFAGIGKLQAHLIDSAAPSSIDIITAINEQIHPPEPVTLDDIHVRAMYIVSDEVNSMGGRFPREEHDRLVALLVDSPVLVGHRKDRLPIGRTFFAETVERDGRPWVKSYFYWLKNADHAEDLRENIDGGVYKECSISFTYRTPECSVCGKDIRLCAHHPFQKVTVDGEERTVHYNYRDIEKVLETSLVYRGAVPNTAITRPDESLTAEPLALQPLDDPSQLPTDTRYLVTPHYEGVPVQLSCTENYLNLSSLDKTLLTGELCLPLSAPLSLPSEQLGIIVGYRGKERCRVDDTIRFIAGEQVGRKVSRLVLYLYPYQSASPCPSCRRGRFEMRPIPHRTVTTAMVSAAAAEVATRDGAEVRPLPLQPDQPVYLLIPAKHPEPENTCRLTLTTYATHTDLTLTSPLLPSGALTIRDFDPMRLHTGHRFLADFATPSCGDPNNSAAHTSADLTPPVDVSNKPAAASLSVINSRGNKRPVRIADITPVADGYRLRLTGPLQGNFVLQPITLNHRPRHLFFQTP